MSEKANLISDGAFMVMRDLTHHRNIGMEDIVIGAIGESCFLAFARAPVDQEQAKKIAQYAIRYFYTRLARKWKYQSAPIPRDKHLATWIAKAIFETHEHIRAETPAIIMRLAEGGAS